MKLRTRLYVGLAAVTVTFAITGYLVANTQRRYLTQQVDQQLRSALPFATRLLNADGGGGGGSRDRPAPPEGTGNLSELYVGHLDPDGTLTSFVAGELGKGEPKVSVAKATAAGESGNGFNVTPFTADGHDTSSRFRVIVLRQRNFGGWDIVALSMNRADNAYQRLLIASGIAALVVLAVIALTAAWVVRLGVKPINDMTAAADAITAGDHERRVGSYPAGTEAGRLARALNTMLDERQASDDRLRQFVSDASHELRTPLTSIRGYADLYSEGGLPDGPRLDDAMRRVSAEAQRMAAIVDDLLLLSRLDQGQPLQLAAVDLVPIIEDASANAHAVQPQRSITVAAGEPLLATADALRIHQVLAALLHNALVHTPTDTAIEVGGRHVGGSIIVEVADHGQGMDAETAAHAFERFYRGDPSRSRHNGGSGLGLAIAKSVIEAHGGTITLTTAPGSGCRFAIALPAAPAPAPTLVSASSS